MNNGPEYLILPSPKGYYNNRFWAHTKDWAWVAIMVGEDMAAIEVYTELEEIQQLLS